MKIRNLVGSVVACLLLEIGALQAGPVSVRTIEGLIHGFLVLRSLDGKDLASGDLSQIARGGRVTSRLAFNFKDGSRHEETVVYSQRGTFRLVTYRLVQKGKTFPRQMDMTIDAASGEVNVRYTDEDGKEKALTERLDLPPDLSNGLVSTVLKNIARDTQQATVSYLAATPEPRLVKLQISRAGEDTFSTAGARGKATRFVIKVDIGGLTGVAAKVFGKQPPDHHVWILATEAPAFLKSEGALFHGGPIWRIEHTPPVFR